MSQTQAAHWFEYFPGNFVWSQQMMSMIDMANWGAGAMGEIDQVGRLLRDHQGDNEVWFKEWSRMAARQEEKAESAEAANHGLTAGTFYLHAATYHFYAERFIPPGDRKNESYRAGVRCFERGAKQRYPNISRVEVPYLDSAMPAYFVKADVSGPAPTMVCFGGLDSSKEMSALFAGVEMTRRGIHLLAIDGPGQGETLRLRNIPSRYDYEVAGTAAFDYISQRRDVDPKRAGVMGFSMGGYYAPRIAAFEKRYAACVAWGAHYDYHAVWVTRRREMDAGGTRVTSAKFHLPWVLGVPDMDAAMKKLASYRLDGVAKHISCPVLITHGEKDTVVPVEMAHKLYADIGSEDKTLKIFSVEEGGCEHMQGDNRLLGANFVADWVMDRLAR
jgi:dienelactone hydrolase